MTGKFVAYYRVSTDKQGISGLGMDAQKQAVANYLNGGSWNLLAEFAEVETGRRNDRQQMAKAVALCRKESATLLIAKLDRLARNAAFLLNLRDSGVNFVATDMPHADRFTVGVMALVAEKEAEMISQRTKDGLAAAKRRGIKLGNPRPAQALKVAQTANLARADAYAKSLLPVIAEIRAAHVTSLRKVAQCLNARGFKTPNNKAFKAQSVKNLLARAAYTTTEAKPDPNKREDQGSRLEPAKPKSTKPTSVAPDPRPIRRHSFPPVVATSTSPSTLGKGRVASAADREP